MENPAMTNEKIDATSAILARMMCAAEPSANPTTLASNDATTTPKTASAKMISASRATVIKVLV